MCQFGDGLVEGGGDIARSFCRKKILILFLSTSGQIQDCFTRVDFYGIRKWSTNCRDEQR